MVMQEMGDCCAYIRLTDHMIKSRLAWDRASRACARPPRLPGVVAASLSGPRAVTTRCDGCAPYGGLLQFHTVHGSNDKVPINLGPCFARARASASPHGGRRC